MPQTTRTWYSTKPGAYVYHNNTTCDEGKKIEPGYMKEGTGGRLLCDKCASYNREGR